MPRKKTKKRKFAKAAGKLVDDYAMEKKELEALRQKRLGLADIETKEIREAGGVRKAGVFIKSLARRASLNKEINRRRQLLSGRMQIKRLKQQKEIAQLKKQIAAKQIAAGKPKPFSLEDLNKPIQPIKAEDIFKPI